MDETTDEQIKEIFAQLMIFTKGGLTYKELTEMTLYDIQEWISVANTISDRQERELAKRMK
jgi:hypothetical protein